MAIITSLAGQSLLHLAQPEFPPAVDPAQLDLSACHESEEQDQGRVEPLNHVRGAGRLPLGLGETEEREECANDAADR